MAITGQGQPTHVVSQNHRIWLWHWQIAHISNTCIVGASKLVDGIDLDMENKQYNLVEILLNSDNSDNSNKFKLDKAPPLNNIYILSPETAVIQQTTNNRNILNRLCIPYIRSKSSQIVKKDKSMTATTNKLEEVYVDIWEAHKPASQSESLYVDIHICKSTRKT